MKPFHIALLSTAIVLGSISSAHAICYPSIGGNTPVTGSHYVYTPFKKITTIYKEPNTVPIGQVFGYIKMVMQSNARFPNNPAYFICGNGSNTLQAQGMGTPINQNIYPSNLPGIGWRILVSNDAYPSTVVNETTYPEFRRLSSGYSKVPKFEVTIVLIRTGQTSCTGPFVGTFAQDSMDGQILGEYRFQ